MKFYTQTQMEDKHISAIGTATRDEYEHEKELFLVGEAIRQARKAQNLSQEQLGEMIGGQKVSLEIPSVGKVALW